MTRFDRITLMTVRITGVIQVLLGISIWTGIGLRLVNAHMLIGATFVIALWLLGFRGAATGSATGLGVTTLAWGAVVIGFGMVQAQILPGPHHWVVRVLHLVVGILAMALADRIGRRMKAARPRSSAVLDARPA